MRATLWDDSQFLVGKAAKTEVQEGDEAFV